MVRKRRVAFWQLALTITIALIVLAWLSFFYLILVDG